VIEHSVDQVVAQLHLPSKLEGRGHGIEAGAFRE
jgi:hypothetical protein